MFKFDFQNEDFGVANKNANSGCSDNTIPCYEFEEIHASQQFNPKATDVICGRMKFAGDKEVLYVRVDSQEKIDIRSDHTDLIPGVYEGGGKIWECTQDLGDYVMKPAIGDDSLYKSISGQFVLDLGCGAGLLGILALTAGAHVHFSDYNSSILSTLTIKNVLLNFQETNDEILQRCKFYAGDWSKFVESTTHSTKYDVILTSETIYNHQNNWKILEIFKSKLKKNGVALVAAKTYYFGVGGGCRYFEKLIRDDGYLQSETVLVVTENVQREIIKVTFLNKPDY